jgi:hypothetical protein
MDAGRAATTVPGIAESAPDRGTHALLASEASVRPSEAAGSMSPLTGTVTIPDGDARAEPREK